MDGAANSTHHRCSHPGGLLLLLLLFCCCVCQAYLMFGDRTYLDMFTELYVATMRHMQVGSRQQQHCCGGICMQV